MAQGYFGKGFFTEDFWNDDFWASPGTIDGNFWNDSYWNPSFFNDNYWKEEYTGEVDVTAAAELFFSAKNPTLGIGVGVQTTTPNLPLVEYAAAAANTVNVAAQVGSLTLTANTASVGTEGYQAADIDLRFVPEATFSIEFGVIAGLGSRSFQSFASSVSNPAGINITVSLEALDLNTFPADAANNVDVEPLPASLTLTEQNVLAGIGIQVTAATDALTFNAPTHTVVGTNAYANVEINNLPGRALFTYATTVVGTETYVTIPIPDPTFPPDISIVNPNATEYPSSYEICDRTGFKVRRGQLVKQWNGLMVRPESWERRNIQDFVRGVGDEQRGSPRPEQTDRYVEDEYPGGVGVNDL